MSERESECGRGWRGGKEEEESESERVWRGCFFSSLPVLIHDIFHHYLVVLVERHLVVLGGVGLSGLSWVGLGELLEGYWGYWGYWGHEGN